MLPNSSSEDTGLVIDPNDFCASRNSSATITKPEPDSRASREDHKKPRLFSKKSKCLLRARRGTSTPTPTPKEEKTDLIDKIEAEAKYEGYIKRQSREIEKLQKKVAEKLGYQLVDHRLELYGTKKKK